MHKGWDTYDKMLMISCIGWDALNEMPSMICMYRMKSKIAHYEMMRTTCINYDA